MFSSIWEWVYMGFSINKMVIFHRKAFLFLFFLLAIENSFAQKLFIPVSDPEIVSLYKKGEKSNDGTYISVDEDGNIRVKGKFDKYGNFLNAKITFPDGIILKVNSLSFF